MDKLNKLLLPATIIIASLVLGGFILTAQVIKQRSIEGQQKREQTIKLELATREAVAKGKANCLAIYKVESDKWGNVGGWSYDEDYNECEIIYEDNKGKPFSKFY